MTEIQCRMYRPDGTRCTLAPGHTEEEGAHGDVWAEKPERLAAGTRLDVCPTGDTEAEAWAEAARRAGEASR
jgi:hypothetical protein